jgi:hypothetical protein
MSRLDQPTRRDLAEGEAFGVAIAAYVAAGAVIGGEIAAGRAQYADGGRLAIGKLADGLMEDIQDAAAALYAESERRRKAKPQPPAPPPRTGPGG